MAVRQHLEKASAKDDIFGMWKPLALSLLFVAPVAAAPITDVTRADQWHVVTIEGHTFPMPPVECMVVFPPPYRLVLESQEDMDYAFLGPTALPGEHEYGFHETVNHENVVFVSADLPAAVQNAVRIHEVAHLNGCEHGDVWGEASKGQSQP